MDGDDYTYEPPVEEATWKRWFSKRELSEIEFAGVYATEFHHGAVGHNAMMVIYKLSELLELYYTGILPEDEDNLGLPKDA